VGNFSIFNSLFYASNIRNKLDVLENCIDSKNPKQFEDITAGEFLEQRLLELGLKK